MVIFLADCRVKSEFFGLVVSVGWLRRFALVENRTAGGQAEKAGGGEQIIRTACSTAIDQHQNQMPTNLLVTSSFCQIVEYHGLLHMEL